MAITTRSVLRPIIVAAAVVGLMVQGSPAAPSVLGGINDSTLGREPLQTPDTLGDGLLDGLQFADPQEGLAGITPPEAGSGGGANLSYPLAIPSGRGLTPELSLDYDSGGASSWV